MLPRPTNHIAQHPLKLEMNVIIIQRFESR